MRFFATILAAIAVVAFTFDIASARMRDQPNSYYDASGQAAWRSGQPPADYAREE